MPPPLVAIGADAVCMPPLPRRRVFHVSLASPAQAHAPTFASQPLSGVQPSPFALAASGSPKAGSPPSAGACSDVIAASAQCSRREDGARDDAEDGEDATQSSPVKWAPAFAAAPRCTPRTVPRSAAPPRAGAPAIGGTPLAGRSALCVPSLKQRQIMKLRNWQRVVKQQSRLNPHCTVPASLCAVPEEDELQDSPTARATARQLGSTGRSPPKRLQSAGGGGPARRAGGGGGKRTIVSANGHLRTVPCEA